MTYAELAESQARRSRQFAEAQTNAMSVYCDAERDLKELQAENARLFALLKHESEQVEKLRELLQRTWDVFHNASGKEFDAVKQELRELGIEVD